MPTRPPEEIRASIEANRVELGASLEKLRDEVTELTDWRSQLRRNQEQLMVGAIVTGFVVGGGIAGLGGIVLGGRRRRRAKRARKVAAKTG